jgi:hypothetical protein
MRESLYDQGQEPPTRDTCLGRLKTWLQALWRRAR